MDILLIAGVGVLFFIAFIVVIILANKKKRDAVRRQRMPPQMRQMQRMPSTGQPMMPPRPMPAPNILDTIKPKTQTEAILIATLKQMGEEMQKTKDVQTDQYNQIEENGKGLEEIKKSPVKKVAKKDYRTFIREVQRDRLEKAKEVSNVGGQQKQEIGEIRDAFSTIDESGHLQASAMMGAGHDKVPTELLKVHEPIEKQMYWQHKTPMLWGIMGACCFLLFLLLWS